MKKLTTILTLILAIIAISNTSFARENIDSWIGWQTMIKGPLATDSDFVFILNLQKELEDATKESDFIPTPIHELTWEALPDKTSAGYYESYGTDNIMFTIQEEPDSIDPGDDDVKKFANLLRATAYASLIKHNLNKKNEYIKWWAKPCEVTSEAELRDAVELSSGSRSLAGEFWSKKLTRKANCDAWHDWYIYGSCDKDDDKNDLIFTVNTSEWWHSHICATGIIQENDEYKIDVLNDDTKNCFSEDELQKIEEGDSIALLKSSDNTGCTIDGYKWVPTKMTVTELFNLGVTTVKKKIIVTEDIVFKFGMNLYGNLVAKPMLFTRDAPLSLVWYDNLKKLTGKVEPKKFDTEITGVLNDKGEPTIALDGNNITYSSISDEDGHSFKGYQKKYITSSSLPALIVKDVKAFDDHITISNLIIKNFKIPLINYSRDPVSFYVTRLTSYSPSNELILNNMANNISIIHNTFKDNNVTMIYPFKDVKIMDNTFEGDTTPYIDLAKCPIDDLNDCEFSKTTEDGEIIYSDYAIDSSILVNGNKIISNIFNGTAPFIKIPGRFFDDNVIYMNRFEKSGSDPVIDIENPEDITFKMSETDMKMKYDNYNKAEGCPESTDCTKLIFERKKRNPDDLTTKITMAELYYEGSIVGLACSPWAKESYPNAECTAYIEEYESITRVISGQETTIEGAIVIWIPYQKPQINEVIFHVVGKANPYYIDGKEYVNYNVGSVIADESITLKEEKYNCQEICEKQYKETDKINSCVITCGDNLAEAEEVKGDHCSNESFDELFTENDEKCSAICTGYNDENCKNECKEYWACSEFNAKGCPMTNKTKCTTFQTSPSKYNIIPSFGPYKDCNYFELRKNKAYETNCKTAYPTFPQKQEACKNKKACEEMKKNGCDTKIPEDYKNNCSSVLVETVGTNSFVMSPPETGSQNNECTEAKFNEQMGINAKTCPATKCKNSTDPNCIKTCTTANTCSILKQKKCDTDSPTLWKQYCGSFNPNDVLILDQNKPNYTPPTCPNNNYFYNPLTGQCVFLGCHENTVKIQDGNNYNCEECSEGYTTTDNKTCAFVSCPAGTIEMTKDGQKTCEEKKECSSWYKWESPNECVCKHEGLKLEDNCKCPSDKPDYKNGVCNPKPTPPTECSVNADCDTGEICTAGKCINKGGKIDKNLEQCPDAGQVFDEMLDRCVCDIDSGYVCSSKDKTGNCVCEKQISDPQTDCELEDGYFNPMTGQCILDPNQSACIQKGWKWDSVEESCLDPITNSHRGGDGCAISGHQSPSNIFATLLPYLVLLIPLRFRRFINL